MANQTLRCTLRQSSPPEREAQMPTDIMDYALRLMLASLVAVGVTFVPAGGLPVLGNKARIVGGHEADISDFPYQVSMEKFHTDTNSWVHECGASVLSQRHIISAAHCVAQDNLNPDVSQFRFRAGSSTLMDGGDVYDVQLIWVHPKYNGLRGDEDYDVAIFKVKKDIMFSDKVKLIRITAEGQEPKVGERLVVSGWGLEDFTNFEYPSTLHAVSTVAASRESCKLANRGLTGRMICTASPGQDSCSGDSGGPLSNYRNEQVGIVSFGVGGCAAPGHPGVYTNLADKEIHTFVDEKLAL